MWRGKEEACQLLLDECQSVNWQDKDKLYTLFCLIILLFLHWMEVSVEN